MSSATGIELGPDYCVLVAAHRSGATAVLPAVRVLTGTEWPADPGSRAGLLRSIRKTDKFPRDVCVVQWPSDDAGVDEAARAPLLEAGFDIAAVLSPTAALAQLARVTPRVPGDGATVWLALNSRSAAFVIVRDGAVLHSHAFKWRISAPAERTQAHLLRRYLRLAQLAPELRRAIALVRQRHGADVERIVTCGDFPDLRSLTMPLIVELDIEVETLDSTVGLDFGDRGAEYHEVAAIVRLAAAVALGRSGATPRRRAAYLAAAASIAAVAGLGVWGYMLWSASGPAVPIVRSGSEAGRPVAARGDGREARGAVSGAGESAKTIPVPQPGAQATTGGARAEPAEPDQPAPRAGQAGGSRTPRGLPQVDGVLISADLRLAVLDGKIVGIGDLVGGYRVTRIEADGVTLQDPVGREVRLPLKGKAQDM